MANSPALADNQLDYKAREFDLEPDFAARKGNLRRNMSFAGLKNIPPRRQLNPWTAKEFDGSSLTGSFR